MAGPKPSVIRRLFALSCNLCFYAKCEVRLADPSWPRLNGDVAHIAGEKPGSARYDSEMTDDQRRDYSNLMLLCPNHHRLIDALEVEGHTAEGLAEMKRRHEEHCLDAQWWQTEDQLDHYVDLAIQAALSEDRPEARLMARAAPKLIVSKSDERINVENRGGSDAVRIELEEVGDDGELLRTNEPPRRLSPGGVWEAGFHIQTFGSAGPDAVRLRYESDDGGTFSGEFPL